MKYYITQNSSPTDDSLQKLTPVRRRLLTLTRFSIYIRNAWVTQIIEGNHMGECIKKKSDYLFNGNKRGSRRPFHFSALLFFIAAITQFVTATEEYTSPASLLFGNGAFCQSHPTLLNSENAAGAKKRNLTAGITASTVPGGYDFGFAGILPLSSGSGLGFSGTWFTDSEYWFGGTLRLNGTFQLPAGFVLQGQGAIEQRRIRIESGTVTDTLYESHWDAGAGILFNSLEKTIFGITVKGFENTILYDFYPELTAAFVWVDSTWQTGGWFTLKGVSSESSYTRFGLNGTFDISSISALLGAIEVVDTFSMIKGTIGFTFSIRPVRLAIATQIDSSGMIKLSTGLSYSFRVSRFAE